MPRKPKADSFIITSMQVDPLERPYAWTLLDREWAVPRTVSVAFQLQRPEFRVKLEIRTDHGRSLVRRLEVTPGTLQENGTMAGGENGVTTTNLRQLLIDRLVRTAIESVRRPREDAPEAYRQIALQAGIPPEQLDTYMQDQFQVRGVTPPSMVHIFTGTPAELGGRGRETPADRIARAADIYRQAVAAGSQSPVKDVGTALGYSHSQASRYVKAARERGLLAEIPSPDQTAGHASEA